MVSYRGNFYRPRCSHDGPPRHSGWLSESNLNLHDCPLHRLLDGTLRDSRLGLES